MTVTPILLVSDTETTVEYLFSPDGPVVVVIRLDTHDSDTLPLVKARKMYRALLKRGFRRAELFISDYL